jgi:hypothetical protein
MILSVVVYSGDSYPPTVTAEVLLVLSEEEMLRKKHRLNKDKITRQVLHSVGRTCADHGGRSLAGIAVSNPAVGMDVSLL